MTEKGEGITQKEVVGQKTRVKVIRHAPTSWNPLGILQGRRDNSIDPEGIAGHFDRLGVETLEQPDVIVISNLRRTGETAEALIAHKNWPKDTLIVKDPRFDERDFAGFEEHTIEQVREKLLADPSLSDLHDEIRTAADVFKVLDSRGIRAAGGELDSEVSKRWEEGLLDLFDKYPNQTVLVIGHGGGMLSQGLDNKMIGEVELFKDQDENTSMRIVSGARHQQ